MYVVGEGRTGMVPKQNKAGMLLPFSDREFKVRNSTFRIHLAAVKPYIIYLKLRSTNPVNVRASLWQPMSYAENSVSINILLGIFLGAFLVIFALCVMLWRVKRAPTDFWWMIYIAAEAFTMCLLAPT